MLLRPGDRVSFADGMTGEVVGNVPVPRTIDLVQVLLADGTLERVPDWVPTLVRPYNTPRRFGVWRIRRKATWWEGGYRWLWVATSPTPFNGIPVIRIAETFEGVLGMVRDAVAEQHPWALPMAQTAE